MNVVDAILSPSLAKKRRAPDMKALGISLVAGGAIVVTTGNTARQGMQGLTIGLFGAMIYLLGMKWE